MPKSYLSFLVGRLVRLRLPGGLGRLSVRIFVRLFRIDLSLAEEPAEYSCIGELFVRRLKPELRPIASGVVSPVDGTLREFGRVSSGEIQHIKGRPYTVSELLGGHADAGAFQSGCYFNLYLSPRDYHHIHSPVAGRIAATSHIPGKLWPVNDWSLERIDRLFVVNERVVSIIESSFGLVAVVMVGATNVGMISLTYSSLVTNQAGSFLSRPPISHVAHSEPIPVAAGERLGIFNMGSSVILLLEWASETKIPNGSLVKFGCQLSAID